jgi:hypothetical protein
MRAPFPALALVEPIRAPAAAPAAAPLAVRDVVVVPQPASTNAETRRIRMTIDFIIVIPGVDA